MTKFILIILDGFGLRDEERGNAYKLAKTPELDRLLNDCSMIPIETSGRFVGLPDGIMGNSEVGHMNMGAGRIVKQDLVKINDEIKSNNLKNNPELIGGKNRFDSEIIKHTNGRIFCKAGAEGVLLFSDSKKQIGGIIKITDGNERAVPSAAIKIFYDLGLINNEEKIYLNKWLKQIIYNHANNKIGEIFSEMQ